jgi:hypothetical protein
MTLLMCLLSRTTGGGGGRRRGRRSRRVTEEEWGVKLRSGAAMSFRRGGAGRWAQHRASGTEDGAGTSRRRGTGGSRSGPRWALDGGVVWRCSDGDGGTASDFGSLTVSLWNPLGSRVSSRGTLCYIGGISLVSVILKCPTPKISIFGVGCLYTIGTYDYWYWLY